MPTLAADSWASDRRYRGITNAPAQANRGGEAHSSVQAKFNPASEPRCSSVEVGALLDFGG